jgi:hypothetical protein
METLHFATESRITHYALDIDLDPLCRSPDSTFRWDRDFDLIRHQTVATDQKAIAPMFLPIAFNAEQPVVAVAVRRGKRTPVL